MLNVCGSCETSADTSGGSDPRCLSGFSRWKLQQKTKENGEGAEETVGEASQVLTWLSFPTL